MSRRRRVALICTVLAPALTACGSGSSSKPAGGEAATTPAPTATTTATPPAPKKPRVKVPRGKPPKHLVKRDLRVGTGPPAAPGQTVTVQYVGVNYKTGKQFDASWDRGQPFSFPLGQGQVIAGWDRGVVGMRPGGRRELIIPPTLGYGAQGAPPAIKPNETLVFVIDLISAQ